MTNIDLSRYNIKSIEVLKNYRVKRNVTDKVWQWTILDSVEKAEEESGDLDLHGFLVGFNIALSLENLKSLEEEGIIKINYKNGD